MKNKIDIDIPFGAKDSELKGWEYTIPENMEAEIKDGKIIVREKESGDERTRKNLVEFLDDVWHLGKNANFDRWGKADCADWIAYLERQKEPNLSHIEDIDYKENLDLSKNAVGMIRDGAAYYMMNSKSRQEVLDWLENIPKIIEQLTIRINELEKQKEQNIYKSSKSEIDFAKRYSEDVWEKLMSKFKAVEGYSIGCNDVSDIVLHAILNAFKWQKEQKPAEWSREDEEMLLSVIEYVQSYPAHRQSVVNWLQCKLKSLRPQPHWKPSEEQMDILDKVYHYLWADRNATADMQDGLGDFIDDLKTNVI